MYNCLYLHARLNIFVKMRIIEKSSKEEFITFYVDLWQLLNLPEKLRVDDRLKEFLIYLVIMYNEGWTLNSKEAVYEVADRMGFKNRDEVYNYRKKLKEQGLLLQTKTDLILPPALQLKKIPSKITFNFAVTNEYEI